MVHFGHIDVLVFANFPWYSCNAIEYRSNANDGNELPRYYIPTSFRQNKRVGFAPRHYFSSLVFARLFLYFSHFYYFFVAITPGLQTTVSSVVWSACFCCCLLYHLQADFQPVRIPQLTKKNSETHFVSPNFLAER